MTILRADEAAIGEAARRLAAGQLVAFPTETVYGLGADAASERAVAAIYALKGRPVDHPLIVHVRDLERAREWADLDDEAVRLAEAFWPGPLTLIARRRPQAPPWACGGQDTIGLRCPDHPVARALLDAFARIGGTGIAAPSANRFGRVSPTTAWHVADDLGEDAPLVLDGGPCRVGVESTIVDVSRGEPVLLRPGGVAVADLERVLGRPLRAADAGAPRASGTLAAHYAPRTALELVDAASIDRRIGEHVARGLRVAVWSRERPSQASAIWQPAPADPPAFARSLYGTLRALDKRAVDRILVEAPPADGAWAAIRDRLQRAARAFVD